MTDSGKKLNVAMIGLGFGAEFIPIYQSHPLGNIHALCQRNEANLKKIGETFGIGKFCTKYENVLKDLEVDFVHINTPIQYHTTGRKACDVYRFHGNDH